MNFRRPFQPILLRWALAYAFGLSVFLPNANAGHGTESAPVSYSPRCVLKNLAPRLEPAPVVRPSPVKTYLPVVHDQPSGTRPFIVLGIFGNEHEQLKYFGRFVKHRFKRPIQFYRQFAKELYVPSKHVKSPADVSNNVRLAIEKEISYSPQHKIIAFNLTGMNLSETLAAKDEGLRNTDRELRMILDHAHYRERTRFFLDEEELTDSELEELLDRSRLHVFKDESSYTATDPNFPGLIANGELIDGRLEMSYVMINEQDGSRSPLLRGKEQYAEIIAHFGNRIRSILDSWTYGPNLEVFNQLTNQGMSPVEAAKKTWSGTQALKHGFTRVTVERLEGRRGSYQSVSVRFEKPAL